MFMFYLLLVFFLLLTFSCFLFQGQRGDAEYVGLALDAREAHTRDTVWRSLLRTCAAGSLYGSWQVNGDGHLTAAEIRAALLAMPELAQIRAMVGVASTICMETRPTDDGGGH